MAVAPLFVSSMQVLQDRLRFGKAVSTDEAFPIFEECVRNARAMFVRELGLGRVTQILATTDSDNPTTSAGHVRQVATLCEVKAVRLEMLQAMPSAWLDQFGGVDKQWNEEAPVRERTPETWQTERERLQLEIQEYLEVLSAEDVEADDSTGRFWDGSPETETPLVGESLGVSSVDAETSDP